MSLVDDARSAIEAAEQAFGAVVGAARAAEQLEPLADRALRGDAYALAELERLATDRSVEPAFNVAARGLLEYVRARKKLGLAATRAGAGLYPGQYVGPGVLIGVGLVVLFLWARRR